MAKDPGVSDVTVDAGPITMSVSAAQDTIRQASIMLAEFPNGFQKAMRTAITRTERKLRQNTDARIQERYDVTRANIRAKENVKIRYTIGEGVQVNIEYSGTRLPLVRFGGATRTPNVYKNRWVRVPVHGEYKWVHPSTPARGHTLTSTSPYQFVDAFTQRMQSGHVSIFENTNGMTSEGSEQIRELMGPAVPQMLGQETVADNLTNDAYKDLSQEVDDAVLRILNGRR